MTMTRHDREKGKRKSVIGSQLRLQHGARRATDRKKVVSKRERTAVAQCLQQKPTDFRKRRSRHLGLRYRTYYDKLLLLLLCFHHHCNLHITLLMSCNDGGGGGHSFARNFGLYSQPFYCHPVGISRGNR